MLFLNVNLQAHCEALRVHTIDILCQLPVQSSFVLLGSSFGAPKLTPCSPLFPLSRQIDARTVGQIMREGLESLNNHHCIQTSLPIRNGGLDLRLVIAGFVSLIELGCDDLITSACYIGEM